MPSPPSMPSMPSPFSPPMQTSSHFPAHISMHEPPAPTGSVGGAGVGGWDSTMSHAPHVTLHMSLTVESLHALVVCLLLPSSHSSVVSKHSDSDKRRPHCLHV